MFVGKYTDKIEPRTSLSLAFLFEFFVNFAMFMSVPGKFFFYISSPLFHVAHHTKSIAMRAYV